MEDEEAFKERLLTNAKDKGVNREKAAKRLKSLKARQTAKPSPRNMQRNRFCCQAPADFSFIEVNERGHLGADCAGILDMLAAQCM